MDLGTQIRDYAEAVDAAQEPLSLDEITERRLSDDPVRPIDLRAHPVEFPPRRQRLVALAAAVVVLVVLGGVALLQTVIGSDAPVVTTPPTDAVSSFTWSRVPHDEAVFGGPGGQQMYSVTVGGPGLVAVGMDRSVGEEWDAAVWTSPDGITWERVAHDEAVFGGARKQVMNSVTVGGPGLVAVGSEASIGADGDGDAAVWTSPDGITWDRVPDGEAVFSGDGYQTMFSVTAAGPGLVAVGVDARVGDRNTAVWTSVDGITWSRVPHGEADFGVVIVDGETVVGETNVTVGGPGLVAVGSAGTLEERDPQGNQTATFSGVAAVWTSVDGITWSRVPHEGGIVSPDGQSLGVSRSDFDFGIPFQAMKGVTVAGVELIAVGLAGSSSGWDAAVWTSPDGITWSRIPHDESVFGGADSPRMSSVIVGGPGLVAVGWDGSGDGGFDNDFGDAAVWVAVPED